MGLFGSKCACDCAKQPNLGGRIIQSISATQNTTILDPYYHGQMAPKPTPKVGRKKLVCFYCNKRSNIQYDGLITQWECARCKSMNFLDENGDITDPPVATDHVSSSDLKYSFSRAESPSSETTSQGSRSTYFCARCLQNQHLYHASLQQFHVEIDPSHPEYRASERKLIKYREKLEKLYPQICEDCLPKAWDRIGETKKLARSDKLRRMLDTSRRMRLVVRGATLAGTRDCVGRFLWYIGLFGQVLWHIIALATIAEQYHTTIPDSSIPAYISAVLPILSEASSFLPKGSSLGHWGLICSTASIWWNPKFRELDIGFTTHIKGYGDWYKHQFILLLLRGLFYFVMRDRDFAEIVPGPVAGAHLFVLLFVTLVTSRSNRHIKIDMTSWYETPPRPRYVGPGSSPKQNGKSIQDALNEIGANPSRSNRAAFTPSPPSSQRYRPEPYQPGSIRIGHDRPASIQSLKALNVSSNKGRTSPLVNNAYSPASEKQPPIDQQYASMDWSPEPSQPKSQHRAFTENLPVDKDAVFFGRAAAQKNTKLFGQSPIAPQATFWYKVPPAPIAPAHQLRNPPNQPRMRVSSREQKEDVFSNISRRSPTSQEHGESTASEKFGSQRQGIEFTQQKFFPPQKPSEGHDDLVDALTGWSLGDVERRRSPENAMQNKSRARHIGQGIALTVALIFWNQAINYPSEHTRNIILAVMVGCLCIGARTILDNSIYTEEEEMKGQNVGVTDVNVENVVAHTIGLCLGGLECAAAGYGLIEIVSGRADFCQSCGPLGTILVGGMMVHELWIASFG